MAYHRAPAVEKMTTEQHIAAIKSAARRIYVHLGEGHSEPVYERAMAVEFRHLKIPYDIEHHVEVFYRKQSVGMHRLDFIVDGAIAVELKAVTSGITKGHVAQTTAYMRATDFASAIIVNFPSPWKDSPDFKVISREELSGAKPS